MKKIRKGTQAGNAEKVTALVTKLNRYRHEYYNLAASSVPDAVYDHLFDELQELEKQTGIILSNLEEDFRKQTWSMLENFISHMQTEFPKQCLRNWIRNNLFLFHGRIICSLCG